MKILNNNGNLENYLALTNKQRLFVDAYLANKFNASKAAIEAGYSGKTARVIGAKNLTKPNIKLAIEERSAEIAKKHELTIDFVIRTAKKILQKALKMPVLDKQGRLVAYKIDGATCASVLNLLAKYLGMFDGYRKDRVGKTDEQTKEPWGIVLNLDGCEKHEPEFKPDLSVLTDEELNTIMSICSKMKNTQNVKPVELIKGVCNR